MLAGFRYSLQKPFTYLRLQYGENSFKILARLDHYSSRNSHFNYPIVWKVCTEHCDTNVLCAKLQNGLTTEQYVMGKLYLARFQYKMCFVWIPYNNNAVTAPGLMRWTPNIPQSHALEYWKLTLHNLPILERYGQSFVRVQLDHLFHLCRLYAVCTCLPHWVVFIMSRTCWRVYMVLNIT